MTLGCGGAFYCPGEFVTRGQMASFMQRLGTVLIGEPRTNDIASGALALTGNALNNPICPITTIPPAGYARTLVVTAHASFVMSTTPGGRGDIGIHIINTVDGNTNNYSIASVNPQRTSADPLFHTSVSHGAVIVMAAGQAVKVAIGAFALPGGGPNTNVAGHACQITVTPYSRTGNSTPFDE
ncbi:MAG TPA: hypothetical protein VNE58_15065 [Casimicrobiaceae bacterium]|nr:hypothetical protein [Casimicrobiaceae bacterium]